MNPYVYLWLLLVVSATAIQYEQIIAAFRLAWFGRKGLYRYNVKGKLYVWVEQPTIRERIVDPDMILRPDGCMIFYHVRWLMRSFILTFLPVIPGIAYLAVQLQLHRFKKIDKYTLKDSDVNALFHTDSPYPGH